MHLDLVVTTSLTLMTNLSKLELSGPADHTLGLGIVLDVPWEAMVTLEEPFVTGSVHLNQRILGLIKLNTLRSVNLNSMLLSAVTTVLAYGFAKNRPKVKFTVHGQSVEDMLALDGM